MQDGKLFDRSRLAKILQAAATVCGIPASKVNTHSLRRGGCSAYASAGVSKVDLMQFGRWSSDAYLLYVTAHKDMFDKALLDANTMVPVFDMN